MNDVRSDSEVVDRRQELDKISYEVHLNRLLKAGSSYDRAILSLDTASLGFTFAFIHVSSLSQMPSVFCMVFSNFLDSFCFNNIIDRSTSYCEKNNGYIKFLY